jgi:protoporphyrin/coproporphyrin ferrochelatase
VALNSCYSKSLPHYFVAAIPKAREVQVEIFFSAHGVPKSYVEQAGDPYKEEMEECVTLVMSELQKRGVTNHHTLAYQSRVGPVEWLKPYTDDTIVALGQQGCKSLLAVPISFVSEHIETLEEIDMEYRELAGASGILNWGRVPALNVNRTFIGDLADAVVEALPYVGAMIGSTDSLVPVGNVETLLAVYDGERRQLPAPENLQWQPGWTLSSEAWNGRIAMVALAIIVLLEALTGRSVFGDLFFSSVRPFM